MAWLRIDHCEKKTLSWTRATEGRAYVELMALPNVAGNVSVIAEEVGARSGKKVFVQIPFEKLARFVDAVREDAAKKNPSIVFQKNPGVAKLKKAGVKVNRSDVEFIARRLKRIGKIQS